MDHEYSVPPGKLRRLRKSNKICCVPFCSNYTLHGRTSLHWFPKDEILKKAWMHVLKIGNDTLPKEALVCSEHFLPSDFKTHQFTIEGARKKRLKPFVVPTQNLPHCPAQRRSDFKAAESAEGDEKDTGDNPGTNDDEEEAQPEERGSPKRNSQSQEKSQNKSSIFPDAEFFLQIGKSVSVIEAAAQICRIIPTLLTRLDEVFQIPRQDAERESNCCICKRSPNGLNVDQPPLKRSRRKRCKSVEAVCEIIGKRQERLLKMSEELRRVNERTEGHLSRSHNERLKHPGGRSKTTPRKPLPKRRQLKSTERLQHGNGLNAAQPPLKRSMRKRNNVGTANNLTGKEQERLLEMAEELRRVNEMTEGLLNKRLPKWSQLVTKSLQPNKMYWWDESDKVSCIGSESPDTDDTDSQPSCNKTSSPAKEVGDSRDSESQDCETPAKNKENPKSKKVGESSVELENTSSKEQVVTSTEEKDSSKKSTHDKNLEPVKFCQISHTL